MELTREVILGPSDLDRLSIKCKSCAAELVVSLGALVLAGTADRDLKKPELPVKCPSCNEDWSEVYRAVKAFREGVDGLKEYLVSFRVPAPHEKRE
jgi:hypothetical protein